MDMGKQKLVDKTLQPLEGSPMPQQLSGMTVAQALQNRLAFTCWVAIRVLLPLTWISWSMNHW